MSLWTEPDSKTRLLIIAVLLPGGVVAGDFFVCVLEGARELHLSVQWPVPLCDPFFVNIEFISSSNINGLSVDYRFVL